MVEICIPAVLTPSVDYIEWPLADLGKHQIGSVHTAVSMAHVLLIGLDFPRTEMRNDKPCGPLTVSIGYGPLWSTPPMSSMETFALVHHVRHVAVVTRPFLPDCRSPQNGRQHVREPSPFEVEYPDL